jgi:GT2 family glycosyltransferase
MSKPDVDILIGSKDGKDHLSRCLEFVYEQVYEGRIRTTVVDNNSKDASVFLVNSRYPQVQLLVYKEDFSLANAYNRALAKNSGKYVLFLHEDAELMPNFVAEQVDLLENWPKLGSAGARIHLGREEAGSEVMDSVGLDLRGGSPILAEFGRKASESLPVARDIFGPSGAAGFWRRECLETILEDSLLFDEDLEGGYLDLDIAWRAQWMGWKSVHNPKAVAAHMRGSLYAKDANRERLHQFQKIRSQMLCYRKNMIFGGWKKYSKSVRSAVRREAYQFMRNHGAVHGFDLWFSTRKDLRKMAEKADVLEKKAVVKPDEIYRGIFSLQAMKRK